MSKPLRVLDDSSVQSLLYNAEFLNEFPAFKDLQTGVAASRGGCGSCKKRAQRAQTVNTVKQRIAQLSDADKLRLKAILGANKVRVIYRQGAAKTNLTF